MKNTLYACASVLCLALAGCAVWLTVGVRQDIHAATARATTTLDTARGDLAVTLAGVLNESVAWRMTADGRLASIERRADAQLTEARATLARELAGVRADLRPVLTEAQRTVAAARPVLDSSDRAVRLLTPQLLGTTAATKVFMGQGATMMREIQRATPQSIVLFQDFLRQGQETNIQITGIATDAHTWTRRLTAPQPWWKKAGNGAVMLGAAALKGGVF